MGDNIHTLADRRRQKCEVSLISAALDLVDCVSCTGAVIPIVGTTPALYVLIGDAMGIKSLALDL